MNIFKRFIIISMFFIFIILTVTGIIKFPEIQKYFLFIYNYLPAAKITFIHDWTGIILLVLIIIHLILKREGLVKAFSGNNLNLKKVLKAVPIIIGLTFIIGFAIFIKVNYFNADKPIKLSSVEVREYQGEKLGSINDFRENSIKGPQFVDINNYQLEITGLISAPKSYSYNDILKLPAYQKVVTINCVEGWSVKALWEGVLVKDLLKNLTIKPEAKTIIFYAVDGYSTSFPLSYIMQNNIITAYILNNVVLPPERGFPLQLVAEQKWGYKWIKWITKIELSSDENYKGFWESRGYNNDGDANGSKYTQ